MSGSTKMIRLIKYIKEFNNLPKDPIKLELSFEKFDKKTEILTNLVNRLKSFYNSISNNLNNIIVVTHGGIVQGTLVTLFNIQSLIKGDLSNGKNCTINYITKYKDKYTLITLLNTLHLA